MPKTRRLADLYVRGKEVVIDDGEGGVKVWLQKLNPVEHESAMRNANAQRARALAVKKNVEGAEYQAVMSQVYDLDVDSLIDYLVMPEIQKYQVAREEENAAEEEWSKDNYLQGLRDSWNDRLELAYAEDPENVDAKRVFEELQRFDAQVEKLTEGFEDNRRKDYASQAVESLQEKVATQFIEMQADMNWMKEFHRNELYYSVREPDHHKSRYFSSLEELDQLSQEVTIALQTEYRSLVVDVTEGKGSQATDDSSPSSEQPAKEETAASSGPANAVL